MRYLYFLTLIVLLVYELALCFLQETKVECARLLTQILYKEIDDYLNFNQARAFS